MKPPFVKRSQNEAAAQTTKGVSDKLMFWRIIGGRNVRVPRYSRGHRVGLVVLHKPDAALLRGLGRGHELADGLQDSGDCLVMGGEFTLQA